MRVCRWVGSAAGFAVAAGAGLALFTALTARQVEAALPPQGRFIEVDGLKIHYLDEGSGPVLLMIHGLGGQMRNFTYGLVEQLAGEFRVIVMERPGSGYSDAMPSGSAGLAGHARIVRRFIEALGLETPLLVGHSLGGAVALAVALDFPTGVCGLALIAPLTWPETTVPKVFRGLAIRSPWLRRLVAWTVATPRAIARGLPTLEALFGPESAPRDYPIRGGGLLGLRPASFYGASSDLAALEQEMAGLVTRYGLLDLPVGVLFGTGDRILAPALHGRWAATQIKGLELEEVEAAGHMIPITQPARTADFIKRTARRARP